MPQIRLYAIRLGLASVCVLSACAGSSLGDPGVTVGAAASMRVVLPELVAEFRRKTGLEVTVSYAASGTVARQLERGAPLDVVVMASGEFVQELEHGGLVRSGTARRLASNRIVLVGRSGAPRVMLSQLGRPAESLRIAIGDPRTVAAGVYARRMLEELGHWPLLQGHLVLGRDVTAVLAYSRRGEVDAGIVYATDTIGMAGLEIFDQAPGGPGDRPEIVAALTSTSDQQLVAATRFIDFLVSADAQRRFAVAGFGPPGGAS
ncbi:MAG: molybdate ABC transporter substrate-binding protein [Deltaproteobacteria bacterium]